MPVDDEKANSKYICHEAPIEDIRRFFERVTADFMGTAKNPPVQLEHIKYCICYDFLTKTFPNVGLVAFKMLT
jgi:hypothetical protein